MIQSDKHIFSDGLKAPTKWFIDHQIVPESGLIEYFLVVFVSEGSNNANEILLVVSNIFYVHPYLGKIPSLTIIFSNGLKPPTSSQIYGSFEIFPLNSALLGLVFAAMTSTKDY